MQISNESNWLQTRIDHYFTNSSINMIDNIDRSNEIEIDQELKVPEVISSIYKNNKLCTLTVSLWNCRSFTYEKKCLMNSRDDDIIILNETWDNKLNVSGYN